MCHVGWKWPLLAKNNFEFRQCIFTIQCICPLVKGRVSSFEQTRVSSPSKGCFVLCLVELAKWFLRRFLNLANAISAFCYLLLEKSVAHHLNNLNPLYLRMLCVKFVWNWPSGSSDWRRWKCEKFTNRQRDDEQQQVIIKANLSYQLRWIIKWKKRIGIGTGKYELGWRCWWWVARGLISPFFVFAKINTILAL